MWSQIAQGIMSALLKFLEGQANKPRPIADANTPLTTRERWAAYLRQRLRQPSGGD